MKRITTKLVIHMPTGKVLEHEFYLYDGPVEMCGGGPSQEQKDAAAGQAKLTNQEVAIAGQRNARENDQYNQIKPYAFSRLQNGLPFFGALTDAASGTVARAYAPARGALTRRLGAYSSLPSGFREGAMQDLDSQQARSYDDQLVQALFANENAKSEAARLITNQQQIASPAQFYGLAGQGYNSILQADSLKRPGLSGLLGGIAGGGLSALGSVYAGKG